MLTGHKLAKLKKIRSHNTQRVWHSGGVRTQSENGDKVMFL